MHPRQRLITRMKKAHADKHGVRLSWKEIDLLMAKAEQAVVEPDSPPEAAVAPKAVARRPLRCDTRWQIRRDRGRVMEIDQMSSPDPWDDAAFSFEMRQRNVIGMVAEIYGPTGPVVAGYCIYELHKTELRFLKFAVHPDHRGRAVGSRLLSKIKTTLSVERRTRLSICVPETSSDGLAFLAKRGFRALGLEHAAFPDGDGIEMLYQLELVSEPTAHVPHNRISPYC